MTPMRGNAAARHAFFAAARAGSLHHAWLLAGPRGVGKALFAQEAAARLLAGQDRPDLLDPEVPLPDNGPAKFVADGNHPDCLWLRRLPKDPDKSPELARQITVDQVRELNGRFNTRPSLGSRRVVIIDAIDDLVREAPNALLKTLEEPPAGNVFLLVSHAPGRLLPTIRSRCRLLRFDALPDADVAALLRDAAPDATAEEIATLVRAGGGSPGRALAFAGLDLAAIERELTEIAAHGDRDNAVRSRLARALSAKDAQPRYEAFLNRVPSFIADHARRASGPALLAALDAEARARQVAGSARALSLDTGTTVFELGGVVARLAPR